MTEWSRPGVLDQLELYGRVLDAAADATPSIATGERDVVELEPVRRRRGRAWSLVGVAATLVVVLLVAGLVARDDSTPSRPAVELPDRAKVVARPRLGRVAPFGVAFDGRDVWTAREVVVDGAAGSRPEVRVEQRNRLTGSVRQSIRVPQESAFSIASDGDGSIWVLGGGDGAVPETTISRIDAATGAVRFTTRLTTACSCRITAGNAGVWIGGNGSDAVYRLDGTGKIAATVPLGQPAVSLAVVGDALEVGLMDSRVAVVSPVNGEVIRTIDLESRDERSGPGVPVIAVTSVERGAGRSQSWVTRLDGETFLIDGHRRVVRLAAFGHRVASVARMGDVLYDVDPRKGFELSVLSMQGAGPQSVAVDFGRHPPTTDNLSTDGVVAAGGVLWLGMNGDPGPPTFIVRPHRDPK